MLQDVTLPLNMPTEFVRALILGAKKYVPDIHQHPFSPILSTAFSHIDWLTALRGTQFFDYIPDCKFTVNLHPHQTYVLRVINSLSGDGLGAIAEQAFETCGIAQRTLEGDYDNLMQLHG